ncbi:hypothetical protein, partial [Pseudomonas fulva]|uniref:hypothetical protein n=1 Tax=Pseudomonas fulva TaxID=47880 RepID=UPI001C6156EF
MDYALYQYPHQPNQTSNFKLQTSNFKLQTSNFKLQTSNFKAWAHTASWYSLARVAHSHPSALTAAHFLSCQKVSKNRLLLSSGP